MADAPQRSPRRWTVAKAAAAFLFVLVLAVGALYLLRLSLATWIAERAIAGTPFETARFRLVELEHDGAVVEDLTLDNPFEVHIARVVLTYDALEAANGHIAGIALEGVEATATPEALEAVMETGDNGGGGVDIDRLEVRDGHLALVTDDRTTDLRFDGAMTGLTAPAGDFHVRASSGEFEVGGPLVLVTGPGGAMSLAWEIGDSRVEPANASFAGLHGTMYLEVPAVSGAPLAVDLALSSDDVHVDGRDLDHMRIELTASIAMPFNPADSMAVATIEIGTAQSAAHAEIVASLTQEAGRPQVTLESDIDLKEEITLSYGADITVSAPGHLRVAMATGIPDEFPLADIDPLSLALTHVTALSTAFDVPGIRIAERLAAGAAAGDIALTLDNGDALVFFRAPVEIGGLTVDPVWAKQFGLPDEIAAMLEKPTGISLTGNEEPWRLTRAADGSGAVDGAATLRLQQEDASLSAVLDGNVAIAADGTLTAATVRHGELTVDMSAFMGAENLHLTGDAVATYDGNEVGSQGMLTATADRVTSGANRLDGVELSLPFDAAISGDMISVAMSPVALISAKAARFDDTRTGPVELELPLRAAGMTTNLMLYLDDNGWLDVTGVSDPAFVVTDTVSLRLDQITLPVLSLELAENGDLIWDARLHLGPAALSVALLDDHGTPVNHIGGILPSFRLHATRLIESYLNATLETEGGELRWEEQAVEVAGLRALATYNSGLSPWPQMRLDVDRITDLSSPARVAPLVADLRVQPVWPEGDDVRLSLNVHAPDKRYALNIEASYEPAKNTAVAYIRLPPLVFERGGYQPKNLSPMAARYAKEVSGSVEISGDITWRDGAFASDLNVALRDVSATAFGIRVERVNSLVNFDNVWPPSTPPGQLVAIAGIDAGLPLRDAVLSFELQPEGIAVLESARMLFAGGEVTSNRLTWNLDGDPEPLLLKVAGVDVGTLFALADVEDLSATGTLDGTIPVQFVAGDVVIEGASLASRAPGELHYLPEGVPTGLGTDDASLDLVMEALSNFHYAELKVDLDRAPGGETEIGLHIAGANPDLYDGYPIELNVSLTGALDQIVRDSLSGYRIPEEIRERLSGF